MNLSKNDQELIAEAYETIRNKKHKCGCGCDKCGPKCPCDKNCECKQKENVKEAVDQDKDGDNDFDDIKIARMVASGMSKEEAISKLKNKKVSKTDKK